MLVNIGVVEEELRPAIVVKAKGDLAHLYLFVDWQDIPLAHGVGAYNSSMGYLMQNASEGTMTGQWRRLKEDEDGLLERD